MAAVLHQAGTNLDYTPGADATAGDVVNLGTGSPLVGIVNNDIPAGVLGSVCIGGIYKFPKMAATAMNAGDTVEWAESELEVVPDADLDGDYDLGKVAYDAAAGDTHVYVLINGLNV